MRRNLIYRPWLTDPELPRIWGYSWRVLCQVQSQKSLSVTKNWQEEERKDEVHLFWSVCPMVSSGSQFLVSQGYCIIALEADQEHGHQQDTSAHAHRGCDCSSQLTQSREGIDVTIANGGECYDSPPQTCKDVSKMGLSLTWGGHA